MRKTCALTGHRILPPDFQINVVYDALEECIQEGYDKFFCGMATGFDLAALSCLVDLRQKYPITLVACIPYPGQESKFDREEKVKYRELLAMCDEKVVISPTFKFGCLLGRNRYMVDRADLLLAYCERNEGGSAYTVKYAERIHVPVRRIRMHGEEIPV